MPGGMELPQEAARVWTDPARRAEILAMHDSGVSLIDMVDRLGLTPALEADGLGPVLGGLDEAEVRAIRDVFVAEAQRSQDGGANFPVDCRVDAPAAGVRVTAVPGTRATVSPVVRIDPA